MEYNNHILAANGNTVCFMALSGDPDNNKAHEKAALVIAAAPDLRDVLAEIVSLVDEQVQQDSGAYRSFVRARKILSKLNS